MWCIQTCWFVYTAAGLLIFQLGNHPFYRPPTLSIGFALIVTKQGHNCCQLLLKKWAWMLKMAVLSCFTPDWHWQKFSSTSRCLAVSLCDCDTQLIATNLIGPFTNIFYGLFTRWILEINAKDLGRVPSGVPTLVPDLYQHPLTVQPLGVVLGRAQRWQAAQAPIDGGVPPRKIHGRGGIQLPAGGDERRRIVQRVVGTPSHSADLIVDFCQICQLE